MFYMSLKYTYSIYFTTCFIEIYRFHFQGPRLIGVSCTLLACSDLCHSSGGYSPGSHRGSPGSIPGHVMWDLWTKWHWSRFSSSTPVSLTNPYSTKCSMLTYHQGLVQLAVEVSSGLSHTPPHEIKKELLLDPWYGSSSETSVNFYQTIWSHVTRGKVYSTYFQTCNPHIHRSVCYQSDTPSGNYPVVYE
jgi:hypothetical protein